MMLIFFAIACNRQVNESAEITDKGTKIGSKTKLGFEVFKPDTILIEEHGKEYVKVLNPNPYVDYIKIGSDHHYKIVLRKDIPEEKKLEREEEVKLIKKMVNFNNELDSLAFDKFLNSRIYHKGLRVRDFDSINIIIFTI